MNDSRRRNKRMSCNSARIQYLIEQCLTINIVVCYGIVKYVTYTTVCYGMLEYALVCFSML